MDPAYSEKKIVDLSDEELIALGFLGENAPPHVKMFVESAKARPERFDTINCGMVDLFRQNPPQAPQAPTISASETLYSQLSIDPDAFTVVAPDLISKYEMNFWYNGLSRSPPQLMWRSDLETNPFPIPAPGTPYSKIPTKAARGASGTSAPPPAVWRTVVPQIGASIKDHGLKLSALSLVRFRIAEDGKEETSGPVVLWITVLPNTTNAAAVRDATPDILHILADAQITDVVVEWVEGSVVRLSVTTVITQ